MARSVACWVAWVAVIWAASAVNGSGRVGQGRGSRRRLRCASGEPGYCRLPQQPSRLQKGLSTPAPLPATATAQLVGSLASSSAGGLSGAAAGAMIGSVVPGIGTVIGAAVGGLLGSLGGSYLGGMGAKLIGDASGKAGQSVAGSAMPQANQEVAGFPEQATRLPKSVGPPTPSPAVSIPPSPAMAPPAINQQFTFTANMPVAFHNSFDDPTTLQQLETIARRVLDDLMRQARAVQMVDQPQP